METPPNQKFTLINAEHISEPPNPNRVEINHEELQKLADSIKNIGLAQPITVRPVGDRYEVVAGHRRFKACLLAGVINIPCIVRTLTDNEAEQVKAHENLYRQDLNPLEEAIYISRLINKDTSRIGEVATTLGRSVEWVESRLGILDYPEYFWDPIATGVVKLGVAKALAQITDETYRKMFFDQALQHGMALYQAEHLLSQWEHGIFKPAEAIANMPNENPSQEVPKFRTKCAACSLEAEEPNVISVFVHKTCPDTPPATGQ